MTVNDFFRVAIFVDCNVEIVDNENWEKKATYTVESFMGVKSGKICAKYGKKTIASVSVMKNLLKIYVNM
jgi:hypothetical protein